MEIISGNIDFKQSYSVITSHMQSHKPNYGYIRVVNKPQRNKPATSLLIGGIKTKL